MLRRHALTLLALLALAPTVIAGDRDKEREREKKKKKEEGEKSHLSGLISRLDASSRSFTVRDDKERETTVFWNAGTRILDPRGRDSDAERIRISVRVEVTCREQSGKWHATEVRIVE